MEKNEENKEIIALNAQKEAEAKRFGTTVESLEDNGFRFHSDALGDCHWFAPVNGTLMSLAWFRQQQEDFRKEHFPELIQGKEQEQQPKVTFPAVFKKSQGKGAGLYAITAILDDKRQTRILSKEDVQKYFSLDKEGKQNFAFELADKYLVKDPGKERIAEAKENFEKAMDEHLEQQGTQPLEVTLVRHDVSLGNFFKDAEGKYYTDSGIEQDMSKPVHLYRLSPATDPYGEPDVLVDNIKVLNPPSYRETRMQQHSFDYMMLDRLRGDIEAYLNKPGDCRYQNKSQIWGQDTEVLVKEMRKLWDKIPADIKPEWLTEEKLKDYETAVTNENNVSNFLEKVGEASDGKEYNMYEDEVDEEEDEEISRGFHR